MDRKKVRREVIGRRKERGVRLVDRKREEGGD